MHELAKGIFKGIFYTLWRGKFSYPPNVRSTDVQKPLKATFSKYTCIV